MGRFLSLTIVTLVSLSLAGPQALEAQAAKFVLFEYPPYLDPPANARIGLGKAAFRFPYPDPVGPIHPDESSLDQAYKVYRKAGFNEPPLSPKVCDHCRLPAASVLIR